MFSMGPWAGFLPLTRAPLQKLKMILSKSYLLSISCGIPSSPQLLPSTSDFFAFVYSSRRCFFLFIIDIRGFPSKPLTWMSQFATLSVFHFSVTLLQSSDVVNQSLALTMLAVCCWHMLSPHLLVYYIGLLPFSIAGLLQILFCFVCLSFLFTSVHLILHVRNTDSISYVSHTVVARELYPS